MCPSAEADAFAKAKSTLRERFANANANGSLRLRSLRQAQGIAVQAAQGTFSSWLNHLNLLSPMAAIVMGAVWRRARLFCTRRTTFANLTPKAGVWWAI